MRLRREQGGLSLREAARRIGISPSYLVALEQGRNPTTGRAPVPSPLILGAIGRVLEIDVNELMELCGAPASHSVHLLLYQTGSANRSPVAAARQVFADRIDTWLEVTAPRSALTDALAASPPARDARLGMIFGSTRPLPQSVESVTALLESETTWEHDVEETCRAAVGVEPAANICVYREAELQGLSDRLDRLATVIFLIRTHPHIAVEDTSGAVITGPAAIETMLAGARPAGVGPGTWASIAGAAAAGFTRDAANRA